MKIKKRYLIFIIIGLVLSLFVAYKRVKIENQYKKYDMTMELSDIKAMASFQNMKYMDLVKDFHNAGITSIAIDENTLDSLKLDNNSKINVIYEGTDLVIKGNHKALQNIKTSFDEILQEKRDIHFRDESTLFIEGKLSDFIYDQSLILRDFTEKRVTVDKIRASILEYVGLGFDKEAMENLKREKINFILRPVYVSGVQDGVKSIDRYFDYIKKYNKDQSYLLFGGNCVLGGKENVKYLADMVKKYNIAVSAIETPEQNGNLKMDGLSELASELGYSLTRLFSTYSYIQTRYDYMIPGHHNGQEIMNCYYRAISERNIRAIYFKIFHYKEGDFIGDMQIYTDRINELKTRLYKFYKMEPIGYNEKITPLKEFKISMYIQMFAAFAVVAAGMTMIDNMFPESKKVQNILFPLGILGTAGVYILKIEKFNLIFGLLDTILFASLSILYLINRVKKNLNQKDTKNSYLKLFAKGFFELIKCILISFSGVLLLVTFYSNSKYMLEFDMFSGVKISQALPLIITVLLYLNYIGIKDYFKKDLSIKKQLKIILKQDMKVWQAIVGLLIIGVFAIFMLRSGHTSGVEPSTSEILMRNIFEYIFPARPRNKAIFLGYPALMLLIVFSCKKKYKMSYILFLLAATIGQSDILNSFSHIRTPFMISFFRVIVEIFVSVIVTAVVLTIYTIIDKKVSKRTNSYE